MRYGFMYIFPDNTIGAAGGAQPNNNILKKPDVPKAGEGGAEGTQKTTVSVFSNFDTTSNKSVDFQEAKAGSIFSKASLANVKLENADGLSDTTKTNIQKNAFQKFDIEQVFNEKLQALNFNSQTGTTTLEAGEDGQAPKQADYDAAAAKLDQIAYKDAKAASATANQQLQAAFQDAMQAEMDVMEQNGTLAGEQDEVALEDNKQAEFDAAMKQPEDTNVPEEGAKPTPAKNYTINKLTADKDGNIHAEKEVYQNGQKVETDAAGKTPDADGADATDGASEKTKTETSYSSYDKNVDDVVDKSDNFEFSDMLKNAMQGIDYDKALNNNLKSAGVKKRDRSAELKNQVNQDIENMLKNDFTNSFSVDLKDLGTTAQKDAKVEQEANKTIKTTIENNQQSIDNLIANANKPKEGDGTPKEGEGAPEGGPKAPKTGGGKPLINKQHLNEAILKAVMAEFGASDLFGDISSGSTDKAGSTDKPAETPKPAAKQKAAAKQTDNADPAADPAGTSTVQDEKARWAKTDNLTVNAKTTWGKIAQTNHIPFDEFVRNNPELKNIKENDDAPINTKFKVPQKAV